MPRDSAQSRAARSAPVCPPEMILGMCNLIRKGCPRGMPQPTDRSQQRGPKDNFPPIVLFWCDDGSCWGLSSSGYVETSALGIGYAYLQLPMCHMVYMQLPALALQMRNTRWASPLVRMQESRDSYLQIGAKWFLQERGAAVGSFAT